MKPLEKTTKRNCICSKAKECTTSAFAMLSVAVCNNCTMTFTNILEMRQLATTSNNPSEEGPLLKATRNTELLHTSLSPLFFGLQISVILLRSLFFPSPFSARVLSATPSQFLMNAWGTSARAHARVWRRRCWSSPFCTLFVYENAPLYE